MRTDSFSQEKHLPVRRFIADESKVATGLYGPRAIADDIDNIHAMFDPDADILGGDEKGGIGEKNLQDGAVSYRKLSEEVKAGFIGMATKQELTETAKQLTDQMDGKADKADTLSGYGIIDAITKEEAGQLTRGTLKQTLIHQVVVDTPAWANQPTVEGELSSDFRVGEVYYVTLKYEDGTALPEGQFKLMPLYDTFGQAYGQVFTLQGLHAGNSEILTENFPIEFTETGTNFQMRTAGVSLVNLTIGKNLQNDIYHLSVRVNGKFIKMANNQYFTIYYATDKNVSNYHSGAATTWNSDAGKYIWHFGGLGSDSYKENQFFDTFTIEKNGPDRFVTTRKALLRVLPYGTTGYKHYSIQTVGFGSVTDDSTILEKACVCAANGNGYLKNGTVITVTEVK